MPRQAPTAARPAPPAPLSSVSRRRWSSGCVLALLLLAGCGSQQTVRRYRGTTIVGRRVDAPAYSQSLTAELEAAGGNPHAAARALRRALSQDPKAAALHAALGQLQCVSEPQTAAGSFRRAVALSPALGWEAQARCLRQRGEPARALSFALQAHRQAPERPSLHELVGALYEESGDASGARRWRRALARLYPERSVRTGLERPPSTDRSSAVSAETRAVEAWRAGALSRARLWTQLALDANPESADARALLWILHPAEPPKAARHTTPLSPELGQRIAGWLYDAVDADAAITFCRQLQRSPQHPSSAADRCWEEPSDGARDHSH